MKIFDLQREFSTISPGAFQLDFLEKYLQPGDSIFVQPVSGFVTSSREMGAEAVAKFWSEIIFPDSSQESYSAHFPFAKARLLYVLETTAQFLKLNIGSSLAWCDFATGEGVFLELLRRFYPSIEIYGTEHSATLVKQLRSQNFNVSEKALGSVTVDDNKLFDVSTLSWTLANCIDPLAVLLDVVSQTKMGGYVCVAESSRILVPFRKSLKDYFSPKMPADLHPSNFSANTLRCLMQLAGLEICYTNRFFDSDVLLVIGRRIENEVKPTYFDTADAVVHFFREWDMQSHYFENLRET
jgi:hypothetical protein